MRRPAKKNPIAITSLAATGSTAFVTYLLYRHFVKKGVFRAENEFSPVFKKQTEGLRKVRDAALHGRIGEAASTYVKTGAESIHGQLEATGKVGASIFGVDWDDDPEADKLVAGVLRGDAGSARSNPGKSETQQRLTDLLAALVALQWRYWTAHWQAAGAASYGDHILLERLYTGRSGGPNIVKQIDNLGEKLVAFYGVPAVNPVNLAQLAVRYQTPGLSTLNSCLMLEQVVRENARTAWKANASETNDLGLDDMLMALVNDRQTALYLLQQRLAGQAGAQGTQAVANPSFTGLATGARDYVVRERDKKRKQARQLFAAMEARLNPGASTAARQNAVGKGPYPFARKREQYARYDTSALFFALKDAAEAARSMRPSGLASSEGWYMDDVSTISQEIEKRRKRPARPNSSRTRNRR